MILILAHEVTLQHLCEMGNVTKVLAKHGRVVVKNKLGSQTRCRCRYRHLHAATYRIWLLLLVLLIYDGDFIRFYGRSIGSIFVCFGDRSFEEIVSKGFVWSYSSVRIVIQHAEYKILKLEVLVD